VIESRGGLISQLIEFIEGSNDIMQSELERLRNVERSGADLLQSIQEKREQLREELRGTARQRCFAECVTGVLKCPSSTLGFEL
jgi:hypothetical protein